MPSRKDQIFEAVVTLPGHVLLPAELAGQATPIKVGGLELELVLPSFEPMVGDDRPPKPIVRPPEVESVRSDVVWADLLRDARPWANGQSWRPAGGGALSLSQFSISHVLMRATFPTTDHPEAALDEIRVNFFDAIHAWLEHLVDWLEVGTGHDLRSSPTSHVEYGRGVHAWGYDGANYKTLQANRQYSVTVVVQVAITEDLWARALAKASVAEAIPIEYEFLQSARHAQRADDYRRAVLDAATAAEIAMTKLLDKKLRRASKTVRGLVTSRWRQISGLSEALKKLGFELPKDIANSGLAEPRNAAVHKGIPPTADECLRAINIAAEVVEMASPSALLLKS